MNSLYCNNRNDFNHGFKIISFIAIQGVYVIILEIKENKKLTSTFINIPYICIYIYLYTCIYVVRRHIYLHEKYIHE